MPHSKSYPVTKKASLPQPHVTYVKETTEHRMAWRAWIPFVMAGVLSFIFMICLHLFGGTKLIPTALNPYSGMIQTVKQGILEIYPLRLVSSNGIESQYSTRLPPRNLTNTVMVLDNLLKSYPKNHGDVYKNCWLENPSSESPCFFDSSWVAEYCARNASYGYEEKDSFYNPCFIMRLEKIKDWAPFPESVRNIPSSLIDQFDRGFMPVHCYTKGQTTPLNITMYPPKGFSLLFFPVSKFDATKYLAPLVAVKVEGIKKGDNVTVECSIITRNAFLLWNNGKAVVQFTTGPSSS